MRATLVERDGHRATVRLTPSWLARLLGARETVVELHVAEVVEGWYGLQGTPRHAPERNGDRSLRWRFAATGRDVRGAQHGEPLLGALERVPVAPQPQALALPGRA